MTKAILASLAVCDDASVSCFAPPPTTVSGRNHYAARSLASRVPWNGGAERPLWQLRSQDGDATDTAKDDEPRRGDPASWKDTDDVTDIFERKWFVSEEAYREMKDISWRFFKNPALSDERNRMYQQCLSIDLDELVKNQVVVKIQRVDTASWKERDLVKDIFEREWFVSEEAYESVKNCNWAAFKDPSYCFQKYLNIDLYELVENQVVVKIQHVDTASWKETDLVKDIFDPEWFVCEDDYERTKNVSWATVKNSRFSFQQHLKIDLDELVQNQVAKKIQEEKIATKPRPQDFGHSIEMAHSFDVEQLSNAIDNVHKWHEDESLQREYVAPLLPVIQSNGTGKSRLLKAYRNASRNQKRLCALILCGSGDVSEQSEKIAGQGKLGRNDEYDAFFETPPANAELGQSSTRKLYEFVEKLCDVLKSSEKDKGESTDIVLLFDGAYHLTKHRDEFKNKGFLLTVLRWMIREIPSRRGGVLKNVKLTIVCSGADFNLANVNFYEADVPPQRYLNPKSRLNPYEPFFHFRTVGCLSNSAVHTDTTSEYERCVPFGRPLFEMYRRYGILTRETPIIVGKVVLGRSSLDYTATFINVLGTRVQMGSSSLAIVSELVEVGYAHLTSFQRPVKDARMSPVVADFAYMPDPVCARIAMMLMDEDTSLELVGGVAYIGQQNIKEVKGRGPSFWSSRASSIFSESICVLNKGDIGEVAVALYLLFCGDELRKEADENYTTFSVDLYSWLNGLLKRRGPENGMDPLTVSGKSTPMGQCTINAIQFYRQELRLELDEYSSPAYLEYLYSCACGAYSHSSVQAFDLLQPIRVRLDDRNDEFLPCFVSVKNNEYLGPDQAQWFLEKSVRALLKQKVTAGLFLLVIVGQTEAKSTYKNRLGDPKTLESDIDCMFEDSSSGTEEEAEINALVKEHISTDIADIANKLVPKVLAIEANDPFGINDAAIHGKPKLGDVPAIYTDHPMLLHMGKECPMGQRVNETLQDDTQGFFDQTLGAIRSDRSDDDPDGEM